MEFIDYLRIRHTLQPKARQLSEVSCEQYANRFHNLQRRGIYRGQRAINEEMIGEIERHYQDGSKHYPRTVKYYIEYLAYVETEAKTDPSVAGIH